MRHKPGDIVIKTSGGNKMTISDEEGGYYKCVWVVESKFYESIFKEDEIITLNEYRMIEERDDKIDQIFRSKPM